MHSCTLDAHIHFCDLLAYMLNCIVLLACVQSIPKLSGEGSADSFTYHTRVSERIPTKGTVLVLFFLFTAYAPTTLMFSTFHLPYDSLVMLVCKVDLILTPTATSPALSFKQIEEEQQQNPV